MVWLTILICCLPASLAQAQTKADGTISGRVLLEDGQPAAGAVVQIISVGTRSQGDGQRVQCDEAGNFKLSGLAPGSYDISAAAPGYVTEQGGAKTIYRIGDNATIRLIKGGVITGKVTDAAGEPLVGTQMMIQRVRGPDGKRDGKEDSEWWSDVQTDDRGVYRAFGLEPGVYVVGVVASAGYSWMWEGSAREVPTYYPSTTRDAAVEITVRAGEEVSGIDIRHRGEAGHAVSGTVSGKTESSQPFGSAGLKLLSATTKETFASTGANESKSFVFFGVPDGEYELFAKMRGDKEENDAGSPPRRVSVKGADVTGIELRLVAYGSISGRVLIETPNPAAKCETKNRPLVEEILVRPTSDGRNPRSLNAVLAERDGDESVRQVAPNEKGEFTLRWLEPDSYRLEADLPGETWYVRSITQPATGPAKKSDAARSPLNLKSGEKLSGVEITIAEGAASLSGRVQPAKTGEQAVESANPQIKLPALRIHLIPAEATAADNVLRYYETPAEKDGVFQFKHLAPGKYFLLARSIPDTEARNDKARPVALDPTERAKLRREAEAAKNEIVLNPCSRVKDHVLRY